ncbi:MAG: hypothetical protein KF802_13160 [Bdellovibrionaceae bacterium]|nr:hypothetical protein [Pseudobdellovibrionaceae bacterium]
MNCHFVIRSLTEPWEINEQRRLKYFDYSIGKVCEGDSKKLFAEEDINTEEVEGLLNKLIDQPLAKFKKDLLSGQDALKIGYWKTFRALHLYFLLQAPRYAKLNDPKDATSALDEVLKKGEDFLDQIVRVRMETHDLRLFKVPDGRVLCFPATGFFSFPIEDAGCETGFTFSYGVPIFSNIALVITPKTATENGLKQLRELLHSFSVGISDSCEKVVLPKEMVEQLGETEIEAMMAGLREGAKMISEGIHELRRLVVKSYEAMGLKLEPIRRGPSK